jgi:predicted anti-sigma-YlaC factor YlaD
MMCREATERMTEAMEGRLSGLTKASFHLHLGMCAWCRRHKKQLETLVETLHSVPAPSVTPEARTQALAAFRARQKNSP